MGSLFASRRKARKVGITEEEDDAPEDSEPVVKRPGNLKQKQKSKLRLSFGPGETSMTEDGDGDTDTGLITPKRTGLGRRVLEKNAFHRLTPTSSSDHLPIRVGQDSDRPSYSQDYLHELRQSTPSTPKDMDDSRANEVNSSKTIDVAAKFGELVEVSGTSSIPSAAEIREKKARRARLAKEQDFISLNDNDEEEDGSDWEVSREGDKAETRLVRDDEDFAEGFDEFVEDGKISLGRRAEREQKRKQREQMRDLIDEAEDASEEDDSDTERKAAYEAAQTRAAMDGMGVEHDISTARPKTPPKVTSLPRLSNVLEHLRTSLADVENSKTFLVNRMEELRKEKAEIAVREVEIQKLIHEAGEKYEKLRIEAGLNPAENGLPGDNPMSDRGLESIGNSMPVSRVESDAEGPSEGP